MIDIRLTDDQAYQVVLDTMKYEYANMKGDMIRIMQLDKLPLHEQENIAQNQKYMEAIITTIQLYSTPQDFEHWMKNER
jgi:hypothetical protein